MTTEKQADVRARIFGASDEEWLWMLTDGRAIDPALRNHLPRLPDEAIQKRFVGKADREAFELAIHAFNVFITEASRMCLRVGPNSILLDFGCGWGRFSQVAERHFAPHQIISADVQDDALAICRHTGLKTKLLKVPMLPPSSMEPNSVYLVIAYSVFSRLSEVVHMAWLQEFLRILRPGGVVAVTTRHRGFIQYADSLRGRTDLPPHGRGMSQLTWICADPVAAYDSGDYIYGEYPTERHFGRGYGEACISFAYAKQHWTPLFGQVAFIEANARIEQSVILARKPIGT